MTTFSCRTDPITIYSGQNLNLFASTKTCPNAQTVSGPGDTSVFNPGSTARASSLGSSRAWSRSSRAASWSTPSVWDLHLHHVVWLAPSGGPTFASGEEKTIAKMPQGYGIEVGGDATWGLNYMIHNLNPRRAPGLHDLGDRLGAADAPARTDINPARSSGSTLPAPRRSTPSSTPRGLRQQRRRPVRLPRRGLDRSGGARARLSGENRERASWTLRDPRDAGLRRRPPAPGRNVRRSRRSPATAPTPAPSTATTRPRSGSCSAPTLATTNPPAR